MWKLIWNYQGPQRVRLFLWLVAKQRLYTNSERVRRVARASENATTGGVIRDGDGFKNVNIQTDSLEVVMALTMEGNASFQVLEAPPDVVVSTIQQDKSFSGT
ncbi:hypothetical protein J1N35_037525 [Gossypium stocksii]|uniref:Reverse transcriptase zinc-binding domain-containing protein n=1 Tax=Gossypium stocksii TaxID=47602 RepID=A0A9D3ZL04_9ROSI|nr:hypothetical protein J1N35_037525 [Gossypium stocksii]